METSVIALGAHFSTAMSEVTVCRSCLQHNMLKCKLLVA